MSSPSTSKETTFSEVDFTKTKSFLHGELSALGFSNVDLPVITSEKKILRSNLLSLPSPRRPY
ncbi:hypothetical protein LEP1GSC116_2271 [Leptospira interrogans serovar Icterohaemorrhagiae str. Verdun HP]|uniref:Uncharacterized protein n=5 Tax=Leptospira interrogans TaxID=173 RepID=M6ZQZ4_LEPIR|nr:hypothetical protein LEP1GSC151_3360 [Leptospira interrogans serovar Grippotyphosa str. LT2186]EMM94996.1 hypothetical protein LEP1GSC158_1853 [Leptospira interrogans serovar Zanoni str. LT2156]EMN69993.1 hypothetical protein LEP1GSC100_3603 [Leptospira interrogans serovar Bataviae str. UI 08561]EMO04798.1 hypothetical protein LEP1GSC116_2271 [Leptospira interrogans serovar Icterohaemorrhagiae str. Verdun HP]EMP08481.1 hypothetical protein LEP1GSC124_1147 [Leptospira interrogans serovar Pyro